MRRGILLRTFAVFGLIAIGAVVLLWGPEYMLRWIGHPTGDAKMLDEYRRTLAQIVGGLLLFVTILLNWRTVHLTQDNLNATNRRLSTERFAKAVELLGATGKDDKPRVETRVGALFALERLAEDSAEYRTVVVNTIAAYIRTRCPRSAVLPVISAWIRPDNDVSEAVAVLIRLNRAFEGTRAVAVDLSFCELPGLRLPGAWLAGFDFRGSDLRHSQLPASVFCHADLRGAFLGNADLTKCDFSGAKLDDADLSDAVVLNAKLSSASMSRTRFDRAYPTQRQSPESAPTEGGGAK